jgi:hypothetical protein
MTPTRLHEILAALHWSQRDLADWSGYDERQVRRWAAGANIPLPVAAWLEQCMTWHKRNPPPKRSR